MQGTYKIGEVIEVTYQATGSIPGLTDVVMEIYDETGNKDDVNFPDVPMVGIGISPGTGRYKESFTPDVKGKWRIMMDSASNPGKVVKDFDVVDHNIDSIGGKANSIGVAIADVDADVAVVAGGVASVDGKVVVIEGKVDVVDGKVDALSSQIDTISHPSPPMIG